MNRTLIAVIGALIIVAGMAVGWYLISPLFLNQTVDEAFPVELPSVDEASAMSGAALETTLVTAIETAQSEGLSTEEMAQVEAQVQELSALMPDKPMDDDMPEEEAAPAVVSSGQFVDADEFHKGSGNVTIYALADGASVLRFEAFDVTNGPDLHVILSANPSPTSRDDIGDDYVDLGSLKGNVGNQNYEPPVEIDLSQYQSVVIYCMPFHVVFATAELAER